MKNISMCKTILMLLPFCLFGQQELSLHFLTNTWQSNHTNPALHTNYVANWTLPSLYFNLNHTGFSYKDAITSNSSGTFLNVNTVLDNLRDNNFVHLNANIETINVGADFGPFGIIFGHDIRFHNYVNYPKSLLQLAWKGNAQFVGENINIAPDFQFMMYHQFKVGAFVDLLNDRLSVGATAKILNGLYDISSSSASATLYTDPEIYQITIATDYKINATAPINVGIDSVSVGEINPKAFLNNHGLAFDLGARFSLNNKLSFAASMVDIGSIRWKSNTTNLYSKGEYQYDGIDAAALAQGDTIQFDAIIDTLKERFSFKESHESYKTALPAKIYLSASFTPIKGLQLGGLFYNEFYKGHLFPAVALSVRKDLGKIFSIGAVYSYRNWRFDNVGINAMLKLGPFQLFVVSDNILPIFNVYAARNTNISGGINFAFGNTHKDN